ncbi:MULTISPECIES: hypothetical protein [Methylosinus]|nr:MULTISPECIES: hypothetical protein [Methylosinus]
MTYDRRAIMRKAWSLHRRGLDFPTALRFAWAQARAARRGMAA